MCSREEHLLQGFGRHYERVEAERRSQGLFSSVRAYVVRRSEGLHQVDLPAEPVGSVRHSSEASGGGIGDAQGRVPDVLQADTGCVGLEALLRAVDYSAPTNDAVHLHPPAELQVGADLGESERASDSDDGDRHDSSICPCPECERDRSWLSRYLLSCGGEEEDPPDF